MKSLSRMSFEEAQLAARKLAESLLAENSTNEFIGTLQNPTPDPLQDKTTEKVCRCWVATVEWTKNGCTMDGPSIIQVDLLDETAVWGV